MIHTVNNIAFLKQKKDYVLIQEHNIYFILNIIEIYNKRTKLNLKTNINKPLNRVFINTMYV